MAGHSKWNNIKQRKGAQDAKRGKIFQKLSKQIYQAAKDGGPDPDMNASLRTAIDDAKSQNMPNDNIERAIKKATDPNEGTNYETVLYEGYAPGGIAVMVEGLTDNPTRTAANVKHYFSKNNSNLGAQGSVSYMFDHVGYFVIDREKTDVDEDTIMLQAIDAGAEDIEISEEVVEIYTAVNQFATVRDALKEEGYEFEAQQLIYKPQNTVAVEGEDNEKALEGLLNMLEEDDDVSEVYTNAE